MFRGLASLEKTVDHCNISLDELDCKLVLVFHCKHGEEKEREKKREREKEREREREREREERLRERVKIIRERGERHTDQQTEREIKQWCRGRTCIIFFLLTYRNHQDSQVGISGVWNATGRLLQRSLSQPNHWSIHVSDRQTDRLVDLGAKEERGWERNTWCYFQHPLALCADIGCWFPGYVGCLWLCGVVVFTVSFLLSPAKQCIELHGGNLSQNDQLHLRVLHSWGILM